VNSLVLPDIEKYPEEKWEWTIGRDIYIYTFIRLKDIKMAA
jgi:hypothetical protein